MDIKKKKLLGIIIGILAVAVVAGLVLIISSKIKASKPPYTVSSPDTETTTETSTTGSELSVETEISAEHELEIDKEIVEDIVTYDLVAVAETPWVDKSIYSSYYRRELFSISYNLDRYYWKNQDYEESEWYPYFKSHHENKDIAIADITGDGIPELIYVIAQDGCAFVKIVTLQDDETITNYDGSIKELFSIGVDSQFVDSAFALFKNEKNEYYLMTKSNESGDIEVVYYHLYPTEDGLTSRVITVCKAQEPVSQASTTYRVRSTEINKDTYDAIVDRMTEGEITVLLDNENVFNEGFEWLDRASQASLSLGEAINIVSVPDTLPDDSLPLLNDMSFSFASGAGAWDTAMELDTDGHFMAYFHDSDMGDSGDGYSNGTVYVGSSEGTFTNIRKIDDYTYALTLETYTEFDEGNEQYIDDEMLFIPSDTYGVDAGEWIMCLPGKDLSCLDEEVFMWIMAHYSNMDIREDLPNYILFNVETENTFVAY